jgi:hypothetical protein
VRKHSRLQVWQWRRDNGTAESRLPLRITVTGEVRDSYTLERPAFGRPVEHAGQLNAVFSGGSAVRCSHLKWPLMKMKKRMLESLARNECQCYERSQ